MNLPHPHPVDAPDYALFEVESFAATPNALVALMLHGADPWDLLERHQAGDWGDLSEEDKEQILERVEAGIDRVIEQGQLAEQRRVEVLDSAETWLQELVDQGFLTTEQKEQILQRLTS